MSLGAVGSMSVVAASQMGLVKHLPEPPLDVLDADKVDALDAPSVRSRYGNAALWGWRIARYGRLRRVRRSPSTTEEDMDGVTS